MGLISTIVVGRGGFDRGAASDGRCGQEDVRGRLRVRSSASLRQESSQASGVSAWVGRRNVRGILASSAIWACGADGWHVG